MDDVTDDELFPSSSRVIFEKAPLVNVVAQLRFPTILRIGAEQPIEFQEKIRSRFPFFERPQIDIPPDMPAEVGVAIANAMGLPSQSRFLTENRKITLSLSPDRITLTAGGDGYTRWDDFFSYFCEPLNALMEIYRPNFFTRVGLRYRNSISRKNLGLVEQPWSALLNRNLLGELSDPTFERCLNGLAQRRLRLRLPSGTGIVLIQHGIGFVEKALLGKQPATSSEDPLPYVIDLDFSTTDKTELKDAEQCLAGYHELAGRAFRWAISDTLHSALAPRDPGK